MCGPVTDIDDCSCLLLLGVGRGGERGGGEGSEEVDSKGGREGVWNGEWEIGTGEEEDREG